MQGVLKKFGWMPAACLGCMVAWAILLASPVSKAVAAAHVFDPVLSLTGGCTTSSIDPIPDPGCEEGVPHQPGTFRVPKAVTTDFYGNIFISNEKSGGEARVDIFDPAGQFIGEKLMPAGAHGLAVDSKGNLYVVNNAGELMLYSPILYEPKVPKIEYGSEPVLVAKGFSPMAIAFNVANDRLFAHYGGYVTEFASAAEGSALLDNSIGKGSIKENFDGLGLAVDATHGRIYVSESGPIVPSVIRVFNLNAPHEQLGVIDGAEAPAGKLNAFFSLAADEKIGHLFVYSGEAVQAVYEFTEIGEYLDSIEHGFEYSTQEEIAVDNGPNSPNGALNPLGRYLFVPSHPSNVGHLFAFGAEVEPCAPEVKATGFTNVTDSEADLSASINPCNLETTYRFEYTTKQGFEEEGFAGAEIAVEGQLPAGGNPVPVSAAATGLSPGAAYVFRAVAANAEGGSEEEDEFVTYLEPEEPKPCSNDAFRTGSSAFLPDCRAYELVTSADTNGRPPGGVGSLGVYFATRESAPDGNAVSFLTEGGAISGTEGTGSFGGDPYLARRGAEGWKTTSAGPTGAESPALIPGSTSPDQGYSFWRTGGSEGSASIEGESTSYVRYPDGHSTLVGRGTLATDPRAAGKLIGENGDHIVFVSGNINGPPVQLEPSAPPGGTRAIYDRTPDEVTHVVSLLPGNVTPAEGEGASYVGASLDGRGVAFTISKKLYLRFDDEETYEIGENLTFAGIAEGGARIFYLKGGDLFAFDAEAEETIQFTVAGNVTPVNVAAEGTAAYFVSPSVLSGEEENPDGAQAQVGQDNLYLSREGAISFVVTVTKRDVKGEWGGIEQIEGLGLWTEAVGPGGAEVPGRMAIDPSRATPDGSALLFESRANLTGYDPEDHAEVYRYDLIEEELECLSCNPTRAPASGEAGLQSISEGKGELEPFSSFAMVGNLRADGRRAFFQSTEPLVVNDTDELQDVYEWEAQGVGSCERPEGCIYLISSGQSARTDYIYAVSDSGADVFFRSSDLLLGPDKDETPSIYDARIDGGLLEKGVICEVECSKTLPPPPGLPTPATPPLGASGNVTSSPCPKGKHRVNGRCVKRHHRHHRKASSKRKGAGK